MSDFKPYFQDDSVTLYRGDSLRILSALPDACVDAVITDPPYSTGAFTLAGKGAASSDKYQKTGTKKYYPPVLGDSKDQRSFYRWAVLWLSECWRLCQEGAPVLVFTDWRQLPIVTDAVQGAGFHWRGVLVWHKASGRPMLGEFRRDCEFIVYGCKGRFVPHSRTCFPGTYSYAVNHLLKNHMTAKPDALLRDLIQIVPPGGTVLDPFLGGGTTARAASATGRKCLGIELSNEYTEIAVKSLQTAETIPA
jgi:DNA modification methylase